MFNFTVEESQKNTFQLLDIDIVELVKKFITHGNTKDTNYGIYLYADSEWPDKYKDGNDVLIKYAPEKFVDPSLFFSNFS